MNILYIDHYAGSPEIGMEFRPYYLSREWVKMGHHVTIIAANYSHLRRKNPTIDYDFQVTEIDGIEYVWIKTDEYEGNGARRALTMGQFVGKLLMYSNMIVKRWKPDIVIASSTYPMDTYPAQRISKLSGAKYIHEVHDMWPSTLYEVGGMSKNHPFVVAMQIAENSAYRHCDKCVALLPYSKDYMVKHGLSPDKFINIQNGIVEEEWDNPLPLPKLHKQFFEDHMNRFIIGYFGGHALVNALDTVIDAAKQMIGGDEIFVLVGDGMEKKNLQEKCRNEKIENVYFLPPINKREVPSLVEHFDCSIMASRPSPLYRFGLCVNKMYDSMMAGKPIICAIDGPQNLIDEYGCGIHISPDNSKNIVEAVARLKAMTPAERLEMGRRGKSAVLSKFTYSKLAKQFVELV